VHFGQQIAPTVPWRGAGHSPRAPRWGLLVALSGTAAVLFAALLMVGLGPLVQALVDGLRLGLIIALAAIGLSLIFGTTGLVNFAHGSLVTLGAVLALYLNTMENGPHLNLFLAAFLAICVGGFVAGLTEVSIFGPMRRKNLPHLSLLVATIGLDIFGRNAILFFIGSRPRPFSDYQVQERIDLGLVSLAPRDLAIMGLAVVALLGVAMMLQFTTLGRSVRAVADNSALAEASGISTKFVYIAVWVIGGSLAALGGIFHGMSEQVSWNGGFLLLLLMFAAVIVGGIGTPYGAMVGGILIGVVTQVSTLFIPSQLKTAVAMLVLILALLIRPQGLFGRKTRVG
jgi:Branched-chain amino acid ABC-type transport system, permease components